MSCLSSATRRKCRIYLPQQGTELCIGICALVADNKHSLGSTRHQITREKRTMPPRNYVGLHLLLVTIYSLRKREPAVPSAAQVIRATRHCGQALAPRCSHGKESLSPRLFVGTFPSIDPPAITSCNPRHVDTVHTVNA